MACATTGTSARLRTRNLASYSLPGCSFIERVSGVSSNALPSGIIDMNSSVTSRPTPALEAWIADGASLTRMPAASQITS